MIEMRTVPATELDVELSPRACDRHNIQLLAPEPILDYVDQLYRFDDAAFDDCVFFRASRNHIRVATPPLAVPDGPDIDRVGLEFLRIDMATPRLSTTAAMTWGRHARCNVVDTTRQQCLDYLRRQTITLDDDQLSECTGRGFVIIRHLDQGLGVGFLESTRPDDANRGDVRSMYPSAFARELEETSPFGRG